MHGNPHTGQNGRTEGQKHLFDREILQTLYVHTWSRGLQLYSPVQALLANNRCCQRPKTPQFI